MRGKKGKGKNNPKTWLDSSFRKEISYLEERYIDASLSIPCLVQVFFRQIATSLDLFCPSHVLLEGNALVRLVNVEPYLIISLIMKSTL